jgi:hypothetical protein
MRPTIFDILKAHDQMTIPASPRRGWGGLADCQVLRARRARGPASICQPPSFSNQQPATSNQQPSGIRAVTPCYRLIRATEKKELNFHSRTRPKRHMACLCQPRCFSNLQAGRIRTIPDYSGLGRTTKKKGHFAPDTPSHAARSTHPATRPERILKSAKASESLRKDKKGYERSPFGGQCRDASGAAMH